MRRTTALLGASLIGLAALSGSAAAQTAPRTAEQPAVFGKRGYIEYIPGNSPVIISAPHGGDLRPDSIPDRTAEACPGRAILGNDLNTQQLARQIRTSFFERHGRYPHVIINRLARRKLDANREIELAACGAREAEEAFADWHRFIEQAKREVVRSFGRGWYIDLHGHAHPAQRLELGYQLRGQDLDRTDQAMDADPALAARSTVATIARTSGASLSAILRGPQSLGTLYAEQGFAAVPSAKEPHVSGAAYFAGGYNVRRHGCGVEAGSAGGQPGGPICGMQLESHRVGVRDTPENRKRFGDVTAVVLGEFLRTHYRLDVAAAPHAGRAAGADQK